MPDFSFLRSPSLPPGLRLQPVCQPAGTVLEGDSAHETAEAVRPTAIREKRAQHRAAEELATGSDLRCDRKLAEPAIEWSFAGRSSYKTLGMVKPSFKRERDIFCEEDFGSNTKRSPIVEAMSRLAVSPPLEDENRHKRELVVRLNEKVFCDEESLRALEERTRVINRRAEIAGGTLAILDGKCVVAAVPFQTLKPEAKGDAIGGWDDGAGLRRTALCVGIVEPQANSSKRGLQVVESNVHIAFGVVPTLRGDVRSGTG